MPAAGNQVERLGRSGHKAGADDQSVGRWIDDRQQRPDGHSFDDQTIAPESQRKMATNATHVVEWDTSHSPMLSRPELVADLLADLAAKAEQEGAS